MGVVEATIHRRTTSCERGYGLAGACLGAFNLDDHRVIDAIDVPGDGRRVLIEHVATEAACPTCGVLSSRVHQRTHQRLRDVPWAVRLLAWRWS